MASGPNYPVVDTCRREPAGNCPETIPKSSAHATTGFACWFIETTGWYIEYYDNQARGPISFILR